MHITLTVFLFYFFRKFTSLAHRGFQACTLIGVTLGSGTGGGRKKSSKAMIILVLIMFLLYTAQMACDGYLTWYAFIKYNRNTTQALAGLDPSGDGSISPLVDTLEGAGNVLLTLKMGIADSITVSPLDD
jgi:hypothetical protein